MIQLNWQRSHWVIRVKMLGDRCLRQSWVAEEKNFFGNQRKILRQPRSSGGFFGFETSLIEVCRSSCLQMRLQIVANHQMVWVNPLSISSFNSMFRLVLIENDISLWFLLTIHSVTQPRTSGWPRIRISSGEILACRRVQCFCVRLKRNWGGEGEDMLCLFSPSRLCPDLSNSVQLSRKKTLSRCMFWNSSCPEQDPKSSWMPSHSSQNKLTIITLLVLESLCQKTEKTFKLNGESTSSHEAILQDLLRSVELVCLWRSWGDFTRCRPTRHASLWGRDS